MAMDNARHIPSRIGARGIDGTGINRKYYYMIKSLPVLHSLNPFGSRILPHHNRYKNYSNSVQYMNHLITRKHTHIFHSLTNTVLLFIHFIQTFYIVYYDCSSF